LYASEEKTMISQ